MLGVGLSIDDVPARYRAAATISFDSAAIAYFAAMSVQPNNTRQGLLNDLIVGLKADGVWSLLDALWILAAHDAQAARINLKNPAQIASVVVGTGAGPVFLADRGYKGDNVGGGYLETGLADNGTYANWSQNSGGLYDWCNAEPLSAGPSLGLSADANTRLQHLVGTSPTGRIHNSAATVASSGTQNLGFSAVVRLDASNLLLQHDGNADATSATATSLAPTASTFQIGRSNGIVGNAQFAMAALGASLNSTLRTALRSRTATYLNAVGGQ